MDNQSASVNNIWNRYIELCRKYPFDENKKIQILAKEFGKTESEIRYIIEYAKALDEMNRRM